MPAGFWADNLVSGVWEGPTIHQDLPPTVLDALGLEPSLEHKGEVVGLADSGRARFAFCYLVGYCDPMMSIVKDNYQLIYRWDGKRYLYDLAADPAGLEDLYSPTHPAVAELWPLLEPEVLGVYERWSFMEPQGL